MQDIARLQREVDELVIDFNPDILHLNLARPIAFFLRRRGPLRHFPRILTLHAPIWSRDKGGLQTRLAEEADVVVAVSQAVADAAREAMPQIGRKLVVIRNALPLPDVEPISPTAAPTRFLCLGRLIEDKGMDLAIEAMAVLARQGVMTELVIVGNGPQRSALEALVAARGLSDRVSFRGWLLPEEVPAGINDAMAVLVPSRWQEPFGLVALQAAQMGRPVIAANVGGLPEIVVDGETGIVIPPDDPQALADAMAGLLRRPDMVVEMGRKARKRAQDGFDFASFVAAHERAFERAQSIRAAASAIHAGLP